jgi:hypothetical protein
LRKSILSLVATLALALVAVVPARAGIILSELCDPLNGYTSSPVGKTDRFIEIYNVGPGAVDLTGWSVVAIANGADATTWPLSARCPRGRRASAAARSRTPCSRWTSATRRGAPPATSTGTARSVTAPSSSRPAT